MIYIFFYIFIRHFFLFSSIKNEKIIHCFFFGLFYIIFISHKTLGESNPIFSDFFITVTYSGCEMKRTCAFRPISSLSHDVMILFPLFLSLFFLFIYLFFFVQTFFLFYFILLPQHTYWLYTPL